MCKIRPCSRGSLSREEPNRVGNRSIVLFVLLSIAFAASLAEPARLRANSKAAQDTFNTKCALCHGPDGSGNTEIGKALQAADLRSPDVQKLSTPDLIKVVQDGKNNKMPPFKDKLTAEQIKDVVGFVRTLGHKPAK